MTIYSHVKYWNNNVTYGEVLQISYSSKVRRVEVTEGFRTSQHSRPLRRAKGEVKFNGQ